MADSLSSEPKDIRIVNKETSQEGFVILPLGDEQFKDFIKSLLGSPQSLGKLIPGPYEIDIDDVRNLYMLIFQRVSQQNGGVLAQFVAKIRFSDRSSVELKSIEELLTYNEVRPVTSVALHLTWDFVVQFEDKSHPEKQKISVSFLTSAGIYAIEFIDEDEIPFETVGGGFIQFRIEHTARTWASDMVALLSSYAESLIQSPPKYKVFLAKHSSAIALGISSLFMALVMGGILFTTQAFAELRTSEVDAFIQTKNLADLPSINEKLNFIAHYGANNIWFQYIMAVIIFVFLAYIFAKTFSSWVEDSLRIGSPSFVLLTKRSFIDKQKTQNRLSRRWQAFVGTILLSVITGIVANIIFALFFARY